MSNLAPEIIAAINALAKTPLGRKYDRMARERYGVSGKKLAAKEVVGESGGRRGAVSSAGARGYTQFIPSTRAEYLQKYGVDAWGGPREAIKAMELYQTHGGGIESYNPGMPTYASYILGQKLDPALRRALAGGGGGGGTGSVTIDSPSQTTVSLPTKTIPGVDNSAARDALRASLLLSPGGLTMQKLLDFKQQEDQLADVPSRKVTGDLKVTRTGGKPIKIPGSKGSTPKGKGRFVLEPTAMKPGTNLAPIQQSALRYLSGRVGQTLKVGTGTNHNQYVVGTRRQSDHWDGHATDLPMSGSKLTKMGQQALIAFGMPRREALQQQGGLFNLQWHGHRVQVIFNTMEGGNHYNHLHLGVR